MNQILIYQGRTMAKAAFASTNRELAVRLLEESNAAEEDVAR